MIEREERFGARNRRQAPWYRRRRPKMKGAQQESARGANGFPMDVMRIPAEAATLREALPSPAFRAY
jgi:hypothetical protein